MNLPIAIFSSILALGSSAHPLEPVGGKRHVVANLRRNSFARRQGPAVKLQNGTQPVFDAAMVRTEVQGLLSKYSMASDFLNGINLNPDTQPDTDYYGPFNDTPIIQYFANSSKPSSLLKTPALRARTGPAEGAEPILGLPNEPYASFELMPLKDDVDGGMDVAYYGALKFGTPGQELTVSVDTGSADLWIPVACPGCSHDQFDAAASKTYHNTGRRVSVTYGAGRVAGTVASDTVALGALSVDAQRFVAVRTESQDFMDYASSGLLGLAFRAISRMDAPTFFEGLLAGRKLAAGIFSAHLARGSAADGNADGSQICFGCYDLTKTTGPVEWLNLTSKTYWTVGMDGVAVGKNRTAPLNLTAAIDTGSSLILVSDDVAQQFYSMIPGSQDASATYGGGFWTYPCSNTVTNSLVFSGQPYMIHKEDMNLGKLSDDSDDCVGGIIGISSEYGLPANLAIIGDVFLKSWYVTFDYAGSRLGLAPSINNR